MAAFLSALWNRRATSIDGRAIRTYASSRDEIDVAASCVANRYLTNSPYFAGVSGGVRRAYRCARHRGRIDSAVLAGGASYGLPARRTQGSRAPPTVPGVPRPLNPPAQPLFLYRAIR